MLRAALDNAMFVYMDSSSSMYMYIASIFLYGILSKQVSH